MPVEKTQEEEGWLREVRARLRRRRVELGLSQASLAEQAALSTDMISRLERGDRDPSLPVIRRLAGVLGVALGDLLGAVQPELSARIGGMVGAGRADEGVEPSSPDAAGTSVGSWATAGSGEVSPDDSGEGVAGDSPE